MKMAMIRFFCVPLLTLDRSVCERMGLVRTSTRAQLRAEGVWSYVSAAHGFTLKMKSRYKYAMYMWRINLWPIAGNKEVDKFRDVEVRRPGDQVRMNNLCRVVGGLELKVFLRTYPTRGVRVLKSSQMWDTTLQNAKECLHGSRHKQGVIERD